MEKVKQRRTGQVIMCYLKWALVYMKMGSFGLLFVHSSLPAAVSSYFNITHYFKSFTRFFL